MPPPTAARVAGIDRRAVLRQVAPREPAPERLHMAHDRVCDRAAVEAVVHRGESGRAAEARRGAAVGVDQLRQGRAEVGLAEPLPRLQRLPSGSQMRVFSA